MVFLSETKRGYSVITIIVPFPLVKTAIAEQKKAVLFGLNLYLSCQLRIKRSWVRIPPGSPVKTVEAKRFDGFSICVWKGKVRPF